MASLPRPAPRLTRLSPPLGSRFAGCRIVPPLGRVCLPLPPRAFNVSGALPGDLDVDGRVQITVDGQSALVAMVIRWTCWESAFTLLDKLANTTNGYVKVLGISIHPS